MSFKKLNWIQKGEIEITRSQLLITRSQLLITRSQLLITVATAETDISNLESADITLQNNYKL